MPIPINNGDVLEVRVKGVYEDQDAVNILHYEVSGFAGGAEGSNLLNEFRLLWRDAWCAFADDDYEVIQYEMQLVTGITGTTTANAELTYGEQTIIAGTVSDKGQVAGAGMPSYVSLTARKFTAGGGSTTYYLDNAPDPLGTERAFRGRLGLPAVPEAVTISADGNFLEDASVVAINSALPALIEVEYESGLDQATMTMVVVSLSRSGLVRIDAGLDPTFAMQAVTNLAVNSWVGSQLSRKYGGPG